MYNSQPSDPTKSFTGWQEEMLNMNRQRLSRDNTTWLKMQNFEKLCNWFFSMRRDSGLYALGAIHCVMELCEEKNNALLLCKRIIRYSRYKAIDFSNQT